MRDVRRKGGPKHNTFQAVGKKDVIVTDCDDRRHIMDHKTTSESLDIDSTHWAQLEIEGQASLYLLSELYMGREVTGAIWDMLKKPGIRPKGLTEKVRAEITSLGTYCGFDVSDQAKQHAMTKGNRETAELFEYRVARGTLDNPDKYFCRRPVYRLADEMLEYAQDLWQIATDIVNTRRTGRHLKNHGACMNYGSACNFLGLCRGLDNPDSPKWRKKRFVHNELKTLDGDGRDMLSASRISCFLTCRRKHYYQYELGIERADRDESDALYIGNLIHAALEAWWNHFKKEETNFYILI